MWQPLQRVVVRRPDAAFGGADPAAWHYTAQPELARALAEHDDLVAILEAYGAEVLHHDAPLEQRADALFVHDPVLTTDRGVIELSMGKELRRGEERALAGFLEACGVPLLARLDGEARAEGGDLLWLDPQTLAVGQGFRTNREGLRQLGAALAPLGVEVLPVELPYFQGPAACLHLMSLISVLDERLAVIFPSLLPVSFHQELARRDFDLVVVPEEEFATLGPNVLALGPRDCVALEGNEVTRKRLEDAGCRVQTYRGEELSLKAEGGATCLTRPVLRG